MPSKSRSIQSNKNSAEASKQLLVQASQLIKQVKGAADPRSDPRAGSGSGPNQRTASSSSDFFAKLKTTAQSKDTSARSKKLLHLCAPSAVPPLASMAIPRPGSSHVKTLSSTSASGAQHVSGLGAKGHAYSPTKALKDSLIEKEKGLQDIETKLQTQTKGTRRPTQQEHGRAPGEEKHKHNKKRGHNTILVPPMPHSVRGDHVRRISSKGEPTSSACLLEAPRQFAEGENQEESTKTGKESTEGTKVQQLKGKLKMLMLGPARCGKLPSKKSSASNYNTLNYSPKNKSSPHKDTVRTHLGNSKKSAVLDPSPQPPESPEVLLPTQARQKAPLIEQLNHLKHRLTHVLAKVPHCIGTLQNELQQLSLQVPK